MRHTKSSIVKEKTKQEVEADIAKKRKENKKNVQIGGPKTFSIELVDPQSPRHGDQNSHRASIQNLSQSFHQGVPTTDLRQTMSKTQVPPQQVKNRPSGGGQGGNQQQSMNREFKQD